MNFLLRTAYPIAPEQSAGNESKGSETVIDEQTTLQGLIGEDSYSKSSSSEDGDRENDDGGVARRSASDSSTKSQVSFGSHSDVTEEEGWIMIPFKKLPSEWNCAPDIQALRILDRSFLFPGEQIHILACLATSKQDTEVITPFKVAAAISRNCNIKQSINSQKEGDASDITTGNADGEGPSMSNENLENGYQPSNGNGSLEDISATESLIRMEIQKQKTEMLLERLKRSHFFVRISDSDVPLWSKKGNAAKSDSELGNTFTADDGMNAIIDRGNFDGISAGGMARNSVTCCSLSNGDIVVLLQVIVGTDSMKDPFLEILQFEQFPSDNSSSVSNQVADAGEDPCGELLTWLLPLDRTLPPHPAPVLSTIPSVVGANSHRPTLSASGSQIFSLSHFRSYSMPSMPQTGIAPSVALPSAPKSNFDLEDFSDVALDKPMKRHFVGTGSLSSFRGVPLEPERYSVQCGLGGIYLPGRRWRRKVEIIQPVEIHTFAANCNTEDLLCVQIKNVSPMHAPEILIFVDSIDIVFDEAPKHSPLCLPMTCIETGNGHSLPNLALRRGEEHSFLLKPAVTSAKDHKTGSGKGSQSGVGASGLSTIVTTKAGDGSNFPNSQYAVLVSCRCNYTESKLFFKKQTSWKPLVRKDLKISVASEISGHSFGPEGNKSQLPVQTLTLEASNLTMEDMTLTILAPASLTAPPSVVSLNSVPSSPVSPFASFPEFAERGSSMQRPSSMPVQESRKENGNGGARSISLADHTTPVPEVLPNSELGCTHLWLQSTVPLGCIPAQSSTTVKLELLPLTDGIITLDTLQIAAKEKGLTYVPEHSLKIHATSSIATGIE